MNILNDTERSIISGLFDNVFDTVTAERSIVVVKEPIKTITNANSSNALFGLTADSPGQELTNNVYTFTPVSGIFPALLIYAPQISPISPEINVHVDAGPVQIKVKQDCMNYINSGTTKHIIADGKMFLLDGDSARQMALSNVYYIYKIRATS